jgi:hypothetical protein
LLGHDREAEGVMAARLYASDAAQSSRFGSSVAIWGNTIAVGAVVGEREQRRNIKTYASGYDDGFSSRLCLGILGVGKLVSVVSFLGECSGRIFCRVLLVGQVRSCG